MYDVVTIGDCMRDFFLFPSIEEMENPVCGNKINTKEDYDKFLVFGLGDKITIADVQESFGGTAANFACGMSKLGYSSGIISAIGDDQNGSEIKNNLSNKKVHTGFIKTYKNKKSSFSTIVSYKGERTIFVYHAFGPENFTLPENLKTNWLFLGPMADGYERLFNLIVSEAIKGELKIAINPGAVQIKNGLNSFGGLLKLIKVIFLNRQEAKELSGLPGVPQVKDLAKAIHSHGPEIVVITDGKEGAFAYNGIDFFKVGAFPAKRLDATGAGDSFASAFLAGIMEGESLITALKWGVANSASVIEKIGAQEGLLGKNTIKRRVKEYRWPASTLRFS